MRATLSLSLLLASSLAAGCSPTLTIRTITRILPDHRCERSVIVEGQAHEKFASHRVNLRDYLDFPDPETYDQFVMTPERVVIMGRFESPEAMPADFQKTTPHTDKVASNSFRFRTIDLILLEVMDYVERIDDIVERDEGEANLNSFVQVLLETALRTLEDEYGERYDVRPLASYLRRELPASARRLYTAMWELRRARRGGYDHLTERHEWHLRLMEEGRRLGMKLTPLDAPESRRLNREALAAWADEKLRTLLPPRHPGTPPLRWDAFAGDKIRETLLPALQRSIKSQYGSMEDFSKRFGSLLPSVFGAFLVSQVSATPAHPKIEYQARLLVPGTVIHTNGVRDIDREGSILWSFTDQEMGLSGYTLWARSLVVREAAVEALGLRGFPGRINNVEKLYMYLATPAGGLDPALVELLKHCVEEESLDPLRTAAEAETPPTGEAAADAAEAETMRDRARRLLVFLQRFCPVPQETTPEEPEL